MLCGGGGCSGDGKGPSDKGVHAARGVLGGGDLGGDLGEGVLREGPWRGVLKEGPDEGTRVGEEGERLEENG